MKFPWPDGAEYGCCVTFDVDAESAVLQVDRKYARYATLMTHQAYGPRVGVPRLLEQLRKVDVRATFFMPGLTADLHPDTVRRIVADGHEVAWHGYHHEPPTAVSADALRDDLARGMELLEQLTGARPRGYRAPWWDLSLEAPELLAEVGFEWESSLMDDDVPYLLETPAGTLVELPVHWSLDDWEQYAFLPEPRIGEVIETPGKALELWCGELDAMRETGSLLVLVCHPFLSGRPSRIRTIDRFIAHARDRGDVRFAAAGELAGTVLGGVEAAR